MKSKITIHTAANYKPCIRVVEPTAKWLDDLVEQNEDVRDRLVVGFKELLAHKSSTAEIIFHDNCEYHIHPVEDELSYMHVLANKWLNINTKDTNGRLMDIANMINNRLEQCKG